MSNYLLIGGLSVGAAALIFFILRIFKTKTIRLINKKKRPDISVVFLVKNNQNLLAHSIETVIAEHKNIKEIIILDFGSIDNSYDIANKLLSKDERARIYIIDKETITEDYFSIIKRYVKGNVHLIVNLMEMGENNPNIYIPDIFKPLDTALLSDSRKLDSRINGEKLLDFDNHERQKNSYIIREHIVEILSNIRMMLENSTRGKGENTGKIHDDEKEALEYLDKSIKDLTILTRLMGSIKYNDNLLCENLVTVFKDYSESHGVSINYKMFGTAKKLKPSVEALILSMIREILYTIILGNLNTKIDVITNFNINKFTIAFKFEWKKDKKELLSPENGLSYYVLQSIHNRLKLISGRLKVRLGSRNFIKIIINIPIDKATLLEGGREKDGKEKKDSSV